MSRVRWTTTLRTVTGAATLAALLLTAACGGQVTGTAQPGSGAPAVAAPTGGEELGSGSQPTGEPGGPDTSGPGTSSPGTSGPGTGTSGTESAPTEESPEMGGSGTTPVTPTSESPEMGGNEAVPKSATPRTATPPATSAPRATSAPATTKPAGDFRWQQNLCLLMPASQISGLQKQDGNPEVRCMYTTPLGRQGYRSVTVSAGFEAEKDQIDPQLAPKISDVTIAGRKGLAYLSKDQTIATAAFNVTGADGDEVGIYVLVQDDSLRGAQLQQKAVAVATQVAQKLPR